MSEQAVSGREIDHATSAKHPPHPSGDLPRFIQLFAWEAPGPANRPRQPIEEPLTGKAAEVVVRQPGARPVRETHADDPWRSANSPRAADVVEPSAAVMRAESQALRPRTRAAWDR